MSCVTTSSRPMLLGRAVLPDSTLGGELDQSPKVRFWQPMCCKADSALQGPRTKHTGCHQPVCASEPIMQVRVRVPRER